MLENAAGGDYVSLQMRLCVSYSLTGKRLCSSCWMLLSLQAVLKINNLNHASSLPVWGPDEVETKCTAYQQDAAFLSQRGKQAESAGPERATGQVGLES